MFELIDSPFQLVEFAAISPTPVPPLDAVYPAKVSVAFV
jgi:hypothetical protein